MAPATTVGGLERNGSIIIRPLLRLWNVLSQSIFHYLTNPLNRRWKQLSFVIFMFRDVGTLIVSLNYPCLRDNVARVWIVVKSATLGLLAAFAVVAAITITRALPARPIFCSTSNLAVTLWLAAFFF